MWTVQYAIQMFLFLRTKKPFDCSITCFLIGHRQSNSDLKAIVFLSFCHHQIDNVCRVKCASVLKINPFPSVGSLKDDGLRLQTLSSALES
jgi:hypothetical protein